MDASAPPSLLAPGVVIGVGLGGFFDGIVLHQVLGWHHLLTGVGPRIVSRADLEWHTVADGLFHAAMYLVLLAGLGLLWREARRSPGRPSGRAFLGALLLGFGGWNLFDGVVDHLVLGLHRTREGPDALAYDLGFVALAVAFLAIGWRLARSGREAR